MNVWPEWSFLFKAYMVMLEGDFEHDLEVVEKDLENERRMEDYLDRRGQRGSTATWFPTPNGNLSG